MQTIEGMIIKCGKSVFCDEFVTAGENYIHTQEK